MTKTAEKRAAVVTLGQLSRGKELNLACTNFRCIARHCSNPHYFIL